jgi:SAM-dependent methyltransferase
MQAKISHLPKGIDEATNRHHYHETLWKTVALDLLETHIGDVSGLRLLDYGCGRGETLRLASARGMDVLGTDVDPECIALSSTFGKAVALDRTDDPEIQFGRKQFDVVTCFHVLEHVDRPKEVLSSLARIARRYVLVAVPNLRTLPRPRALAREPRPVNEGHLQGWDHAHFRNLAERHCGLRVIAWGHDHVKIPVIGGLVFNLAGDAMLRRLETGCWVRWFPFHSASVIALMEPVLER